MEVELESMKYLRQMEEEKQKNAEAQLEHAGVAQNDAEKAYHYQSPEGGYKNRPPFGKGLVTICIFFVIIGFFGGISTLFGVANLFVDQTVAVETNLKGSKLPYKTKQRVREIAVKQQAVKEKYVIVMAYMELLKAAASVCCLLSVFWLIQRNPRGRSLALTVCFIAMLYHVSSIGVGVLMFSESGMVGVMSSAFDQAASESKLSAKEIEAAKTKVAGLVGIMTFFVIGIFLIIKGLFYGLIAMHLTRPHIKAVFGEEEFQVAPNDLAMASQMT